MRKKVSLMIAVVICLFPAVSLADDGGVASNDLINNAANYNGKEIVFTGEVIGDILSRGEHSWINVSDGSNAIGVWVNSSDINGIDSLGSYTTHGDTVRISGIFNRACPAHGGDMDIHATGIKITEEGYKVSHPVAVWEMITAPLLLAGAAVCLVLIIRKRRRTIKKLVDY